MMKSRSTTLPAALKAAVPYGKLDSPQTILPARWKILEPLFPEPRRRRDGPRTALAQQSRMSGKHSLGVAYLSAMARHAGAISRWIDVLAAIAKLEELDVWLTASRKLLSMLDRRRLPDSLRSLHEPPSPQKGALTRWMATMHETTGSIAAKAHHLDPKNEAANESRNASAHITNQPLKGMSRGAGKCPINLPK